MYSPGRANDISSNVFYQPDKQAVIIATNRFVFAMALISKRLAYGCHLDCRRGCHVVIANRGS